MLVCDGNSKIDKDKNFIRNRLNVRILRDFF